MKAVSFDPTFCKMTNTSDRNGRALEYIIFAEIERQLANNPVQITARTVQSQSNDRQKYLNLPSSAQQKYELAARRVWEWLFKQLSANEQVQQLDRLSDNDAKRDDVTDIRIATNIRAINLSIKHNHKAIKHQRPASTAQHCGFALKSLEDVNFRRNDKAITERFRTIAHGYLYFRDLDQDIVLSELYVPTCELVANFINEFCLQPEKANHLFTFLCGNVSFYKVIFDEQYNRLSIQTFDRSSFVESVCAENDQSYVNLSFSNLWKISMRLHTTSSRITLSPSLKFDTQLKENTEIPEEVLLL